MRPKHLCGAILVSSALYVLPLIAYFLTRNFRVAVSLLGIEILLGAILVAIGDRIFAAASELWRWRTKRSSVQWKVL